VITKQIARKVMDWMTTSPTGLSSVTMAAWLTFGVESAGKNHPQDPEDFNRCLMLLTAVPELRPYIHRMGKLSPAWRLLAARWEEIERTFLDEVGLGWNKGQHLRAAKTYALMQSILHADEINTNKGVVHA
jgi:hypothetical protein